MDLRSMVVKLVEEAKLPADELQTLQFVLEVNGDSPLEGRLYPDVESHIKGRFEWFFAPDGSLRRTSA